MAKQRCPVCGAAHKEVTKQCRQCGQMLVPEDMVPAIITRNKRGQQFGKKGIGTLVFGGILLVLLLALGAALVGFSGDSNELNTIKNAIPFWPEDDDGWIDFEDPDKVIVAEMPGEPSELTDGFPIGNGTVKRWVGTIGDDMTVTIGYTQGAGIEGDEGVLAMLTPVAETFATQQGGKIDGEARTVTHEGRPGIDFFIKGIEENGERRFAQVRLISEKGEVFFVQVVAETKETEQYDRVVESFEIIEPEPATKE